MVNRRTLHLGFTADRAAIRDRRVAVAAHDKERGRQRRRREQETVSRGFAQGEGRLGRPRMLVR